MSFLDLCVIMSGIYFAPHLRKSFSCAMGFLWLLIGVVWWVFCV